MPTLADAIGRAADVVMTLLGKGNRERFQFGMPIARSTKEAAGKRLRKSFEREVTTLAKRVVATSQVGRWRQDMTSAIGNHIGRQFMAGAGRAPTANELQVLQKLAQGQNRY